MRRFLLLTLLTVTLCTGAMAAYLQAERQKSYEAEVHQQAEEVAEYMAHLNAISFVRENTTMQYVVRSKIKRIKEEYGAEIWIVSYSSGTVQYLDGEWNTSEEIASDAVLKQLAIIQSGRKGNPCAGAFPQIGQRNRHHRGRALALFRRLRGGRGASAYLGGIFGGLPVARFLWKILPVSAVALALGVVLSYFLAASQSRPVKKISRAVKKFAQGDLSSRVQPLLRRGTAGPGRFH